MELLVAASALVSLVLTAVVVYVLLTRAPLVFVADKVSEGLFSGADEVGELFSGSDGVDEAGFDGDDTGFDGDDGSDETPPDPRSEL